MHLQLDPSQPIYQQLMDGICQAVARGELRPGDKVPSQRELAEGARVNPNTVQRAYRELERLGLVETRRGEGTFIREEPALLQRVRSQLAAEAMVRFLKEMHALGFSGAEIIQRTKTALKGDDLP